MKRVRWQLALGAALILLSAALHGLHYAVFRDAHHIWLYLLGDIAFIPINVLVVTLIIEGLLHRREKQAMLQKMNMVIGVFFTETGNELLRRTTAFSGRADELRAALRPSGDWSPGDFATARSRIVALDPAMDCARGDLVGLRTFLVSHRDSLLRLMENPNLLEHEAFTDVLWGVVHLAEELSARDLGLPTYEPDLRHLSGDIRRAHERTIVAWLDYMQHLRTAYPYLFSLAMRQNPFDPTAAVTIRG